jgi:5-bromo-4-chloroindolyl phosphate hydrolysis protein
VFSWNSITAVTVTITIITMTTIMITVIITIMMRNAGAKAMQGKKSQILKRTRTSPAVNAANAGMISDR